MKHALTAEETYLFANRIFPDDGDLAAFNLIYEIRNGLLEPVDPELLPDGDAKLVGIIGYLDLSDEFWIMQTIGEPSDAEAILAAMEARILELPEPTEAENAEDLPIIGRDFPTAIGAMAAWRTPDGATRFIAYRHPDVRACDAYATLKGVIAEASAQRAGAAAPAKSFAGN